MFNHLWMYALMGEKCIENVFDDISCARSIKDKKLMEAFECASENVVKIDGSVDSGLRLGRVGYIGCEEALEIAVANTYRNIAGQCVTVSPGMVIAYNNCAQWDVAYAKTKYSRSVVTAAKEFLNVCAENCLGIIFMPNT